MRSETVSLLVDELVLDGVAPDDAIVRDSLAQAVGPSLAEHGLAAANGHVAAEVTTAVSRVAAP